MFVSISTVLFLFTSAAYSQTVPVVSDYLKCMAMCSSDTNPPPNQSFAGLLYGENLFKTGHYNECIPLIIDGQSVQEGAACKSALCSFFSTIDCSGDPSVVIPLTPAFLGVDPDEVINYTLGNSAMCHPL